MRLVPEVRARHEWNPFQRGGPAMSRTGTLARPPKRHICNSARDSVATPPITQEQRNAPRDQNPTPSRSLLVSKIERVTQQTLRCRLKGARSTDVSTQPTPQAPSISKSRKAGEERRGICPRLRSAEVKQTVDVLANIWVVCCHRGEKETGLLIEIGMICTYVWYGMAWHGGWVV
jgi:hypothetical protein